MGQYKEQKGFLLISLILAVAIIALIVAFTWGRSNKAGQDTPGGNGAGSDNSASILNPYPQNEIPTGLKAEQQAKDIKNQSDQQNKLLQQQMNTQY